MTTDELREKIVDIMLDEDKDSSHETGWRLDTEKAADKIMSEIQAYTEGKAREAKHQLQALIEAKIVKAFERGHRAGRTEERQRMDKAIREARIKGAKQFWVWYQPILVDIMNGDITNVKVIDKKIKEYYDLLS
jgi:ATP-dependent Clp protease ATP-binding subunit ClpA